MKIKSYKQIEAEAKEKLRGMLLRKSLLARWEPVAKELRWIISGRPAEQEHEKILPEYCYNILELYKRTIFSVFAPLSEAVGIKNKAQADTCKTIAEAKQCMSFDWEKLGAVFEAGERAQRFFEKEVDGKLAEEGLLDLSAQEEEEVAQLLMGDGWLAQKMAEIQAQEPGKRPEEVLEQRVQAHVEITKKAVPEWHQKALEWSSDATAKYHAGVAKGAAKFLDENGELAGESKIKFVDTYQFLLIAWPEIDEMIKARPPKTRNDLWDWLTPFSYAGWIEIEDLEQLNRLCNEFKLRLKKPGAPRKIK